MISARTFPRQTPDERIILLLRRHPYPAFARLLPLILLFLAPLILLPLVAAAVPTIVPERGSVGYALGMLTLSAYLLIILILLFLRWTDYVLDLWIVTTERIINIKQNELFSRVVAEHKLARVQDVTSEVHGTMATLLQYGNVVIQTAGEQGKFVFEQVPRPEAIVQTIFRLHDEAVKRTSPGPSL